MNYYNNLSLMMEKTADVGIKLQRDFNKQQSEGGGQNIWTKAKKRAGIFLVKHGDKIDNAIDKTKEAAQTVKHNVGAAANRTKDYMKAHPEAPIGIGIGVAAGAGIAKKLASRKKSKTEKVKELAKSSPKKVKEFAKKQYGKFKKLPNGEKIAVAAIPATILAGGAAAIYAWWKKNHKK